MDRDAIVVYWIDTANRDYKTMQNLYQSGDYHWSLFVGHLVIEKLLKSIYVKHVDDNPPRTHDLLRLAERIGLEITEQQKDMLDLLTTFNISVRYPDYKQAFYDKCDHHFTKTNIVMIKELRVWLLSIAKGE